MPHNTQAATATNQVQGTALTSATIQSNLAAQQPAQSLVQQWAVFWANAGYPVFPIFENKKTPAIEKWPERASSDPMAFDDHWLKNPNANIAIHCMGLLVIDIDTQAGHGKDGYAWLHNLRIMIGDEVLCGCLCVLTPSGGLHLYFRLPDGVKVTNSTSKLAPGVDVKTEGGYVLAPGSIIDGKPYSLIALTPERLDVLVAEGENAAPMARSWVSNDLPSLSELPEAPPALLQALQASSSQAGTPTGTLKPIKRPDTPLPEDQEALAQALAEQVSAKMFDPDNEQDWFRVMGAGAHAVECWHWDEAKTRQTIFDSFSTLSSKFKEAENLEKWDHAMQRAASGNVDNPFTLRSVFYGTSVAPSGPEIETSSDAGPDDPIVVSDGNVSKDQGWSRLVQFTNPDGEIVEVLIELADFSKPGNPWLIKLRDAGYCDAITAKKVNALKTRLMAAKPEKRFQIVRSIGWQGDDGFFVPDQINIGAVTYRLEGGTTNQLFNQGGGLQGWQHNVAGPCAPHLRLVFAITTALMGPLLRPLGFDGGGFHLYGPSSIGKSTALRLAASVWGHPVDSCGTWRATDNGLEAILKRLCDTFSSIDELSEVSAKIAARCAYMIANGMGKRRATRSGSDREVEKWLIQFLSTGEMRLAAKILEDKSLSHSAGMAVRMMDIPADAGEGFGILNDLADVNPGRFINSLNTAAKVDYGYAGAAFVVALVDHLKQPNGLALLREYLTACASALVSQGASSQVTRAAERFALAALAGEYARVWGVLPWAQDTAYNAAKSAFDAWLVQRETSGQLEPLQIVNKVLAFVEQYGSIRFDEAINNIVPDTHKARGERAGFKRKRDDGGYDYFFFSSYMYEVVLPGVDKELIRLSLAKYGILRLDGKGNLASVTILGFKKTRYYIINPEALS